MSINHLNWSIRSRQVKSSSQNLMTVHYGLERIPESGKIEFAFQRVSLLVQVHSRVGSIEHVKEHALLEWRQRIDILKVGVLNRSLSRARLSFMFVATGAR